jgi:DNA-binding CsgD family transcriptional regulator
LGFDREAVRGARLLGDEEDHARTIDSFDGRSRDETRTLVDLARTWSRPTSRLRVLTAAANDLQYRHGAFREALDLWEEVLKMAERFGAISWQAQALNQLTLLRIALGDFGPARETEAQVSALLSRLGPEGGSAGEPDALALERASSFAYYLDGDWSRIASYWEAFSSRSTSLGNYVTTLSGPLFAAMAALAHARAGERDSTERVLTELTPLLESLVPDGGNLGQNGAVAFATASAWIARVDHFAPVYRRLVRGVVEAGVGDYPQTSNDLTAARVAALVGDEAEARAGYARARAALERSGQRPLRAIVDHDEAVALVRLGGLAPDRSIELLGAARKEFTSLGMDGWARRSEAVLDEVAAVGWRSTYPAGLSEREAEVLRLVARGYPDRQIADALFISPRTVNAHVRNLLTKTDRSNRTELSVWAVEQGLAGQR